MEELKMSKSFRLFAVPNFWSGVASILDFNGELNKLNFSEDQAAADFDSLQDDWKQVGSDLKKAMVLVIDGKKK